MWNKISKIYVWSNLVRPSSWEYTYDFRNKSATQFANDGWQWTSGWSSDSNWAWRNSWTPMYIPLPGTLANAKKITLTLTLRTNKASWTQDVAMWIRRTVGTDNDTWAYSWGRNQDNSFGAWRDWTEFNFSYSWNVTWTVECDLVNKVTTLSSTQGSPSVNTVAISDNWVSIAREWQYLIVLQNWTTTRVGAVTIKVE